MPEALKYPVGHAEHAYWAAPIEEHCVIASHGLLSHASTAGKDKCGMECVSRLRTTKVLSLSHVNASAQAKENGLTCAARVIGSRIAITSVTNVAGGTCETAIRVCAVCIGTAWEGVAGALVNIYTDQRSSPTMRITTLKARCAVKRETTQR